MPTWAYAVLIGAIFGLIGGYFVARKSVAEKPLHGGTLATAFHYLGASAFVAAAPTVLVGAVIYRLGFLRDVIFGFGLLAIAAVCLLIYPAVEVQAAPATEPN